MPFVEDPAHLSIARLKSDLLAHNVALPPAASKKEVYVELHLKNIDQKNAAEFSSDDEEETREAARESSGFEHSRDKDPEVTQMPDPSDLTDEYLREALLKHGVKAGPIVASTRTLYENKLRKLLLHSNGDDELYSDSEEEQEKRDDIESVLEEQKPEEAKKIKGENDKTFSITQMVQEMESRGSLSDCTVKELNSSRVGEHCSRSYRFAMNDLDKSRSTDQSLYHTPKDVHPPRGMKLPQESGKPILKDLFPDTKPTTTGIYVTPRRPIKGAAQRPVQYSYSYPDTLVSPVTLERREVERRLVSIHIQILFFFFVACILFYIYVNVQDSTVLALLDSFSHCFDKEGWAFLQPGTEGTQAVCKQD
ncbi:lamina-associated polypeptide 2, isoforms beta/gamma isoform X8 [Oryzias latipes]|uniref:lamina-associated polypeptide 2, isoforms beta/gamma isoform X8 n=1 Tax=Oryzias latipes TaxID=8090 RepID=UPI000CE281B8|nr:lamina-associated polypeptide 2, isoforms beta/gamma isoform X8 [Oryzias latipes]